MGLKKIEGVVSGVVDNINKHHKKTNKQVVEKQLVVERKDSKVLASTQALELSLIFNTTPEEKKTRVV